MGLFELSYYNLLDHRLNWLQMQTLNTGSLFYATLNAVAYFYMVRLVYWCCWYLYLCFIILQLFSYLSCLHSYLIHFCLYSFLLLLSIYFFISLSIQVCSWGGYTFIINLIPMHALLCIVTGRYSPRLYIAYAPLVSVDCLNLECLFPVNFLDFNRLKRNLTLQKHNALMSNLMFVRDSLACLKIIDFTIQVVLGTLLAALVPVVGFNAVMTSEHFASFLVSIVAGNLINGV